jgi:hypothetical protein
MITKRQQPIPAHLQRLADLTKTVRDKVSGRIAWQRIEQEHPEAIAEATENGKLTYKSAIDRLGYYLRRGQPKSPRQPKPALSKWVAWTPEDLAMVQSFQRYQLPDGRMDWPKISTTDAWARLLTRYPDDRIKGKFYYLRDHGKLPARASAKDTSARADLSTRLTQIANKTHWTEDEDTIGSKSPPALPEVVKFCPYCGHSLHALLR